VKTIDINATHAVRPLAVIAIVGALALTLAAIAAPRVETNVTGGGVFARMADYIAEAGEALGSE